MPLATATTTTKRTTIPARTTTTPRPRTGLDTNQVQPRWRPPLLHRQGPADLCLVLPQRRAPRHLQGPPGRHLDRRRRPHLHHDRERQRRQHHPSLGGAHRPLDQDLGLPHRRQARRVQRGRPPAARRHREAHGASWYYCCSRHQPRPRRRAVRRARPHHRLRREQGHRRRLELPEQVHHRRPRGRFRLPVRRQGKIHILCSPAFPPVLHSPC